MERRNTMQRRLVLECVRELEHPNAEEIYKLVAEKKPNVSRATVYRNHIAQPHCHFRCRDCGKVFDAAFFPQPYPKPARVGGFYVESCNVEFVGLCPACDKKL